MRFDDDGSEYELDASIGVVDESTWERMRRDILIPGAVAELLRRSELASDLADEEERRNPKCRRCKRALHKVPRQREKVHEDEEDTFYSDSSCEFVEDDVVRRGVVFACVRSKARPLKYTTDEHWHIHECDMGPLFGPFDAARPFRPTPTSATSPELRQRWMEKTERSLSF